MRVTASLFSASALVALATCAPLAPDEGEVQLATIEAVSALFIGTPDYPRATWVGAHPDNYTRGRTSQVSQVVVHVAQGGLASVVSMFQSGNQSQLINGVATPTEVSAHYVIDPSDGRVYQCVAEADTAHHVRGHNNDTIGIEIAGWAERPEVTYTAAMYEGLADLVLYLSQKYQIPQDRQHLVGHRELGAHKACPGPFEWDRFMTVVAAGGSGTRPETLFAGPPAPVIPRTVPLPSAWAGYLPTSFGAASSGAWTVTPVGNVATAPFGNTAPPSSYAAMQAPTWCTIDNLRGLGRCAIGVPTLDAFGRPVCEQVVACDARPTTGLPSVAHVGAYPGGSAYGGMPYATAPAGYDPTISASLRPTAVASPVQRECGVEQCNSGLDDDCDGQIDEADPSEGLPCAAEGVGACATGKVVCAGGQLHCERAAAQAESCDGLDNDCNGQVDDVPGGCPGQQSCAAETCNGKDDDCNGLVDDGNPGGGAVCDLAQAVGSETQGTLICIDGQLQCRALFVKNQLPALAQDAGQAAAAAGFACTMDAPGAASPGGWLALLVGAAVVVLRGRRGKRRRGSPQGTGPDDRTRCDEHDGMARHGG